MDFDLRTFDCDRLSQNDKYFFLVQNDVGRRQDRVWSRFKEIFLEIRVGYELIYDCPQQTPMMLVLHIHYSRASDIIVPDHVTTTPLLPMSAYRDGFGNWCTRLVAPAGSLRIASAALVRDTGEPDIVAPSAPSSETSPP
jgi:hypothetical protein